MGNNNFIHNRLIWVIKKKYHNKAAKKDNSDTTSNGVTVGEIPVTHNVVYDTIGTHNVVYDTIDKSPSSQKGQLIAPCIL